MRRRPIYRSPGFLVRAGLFMLLTGTTICSMAMDWSTRIGAVTFVLAVVVGFELIEWLPYYVEDDVWTKVNEQARRQDSPR